MTITLPEETATKLREWAQREGMSEEEFAAQCVRTQVRAMDDDLKDTIKAIQRGFDDIEAGRTKPAAEVFARLDRMIANQQLFLDMMSETK